MAKLILASMVAFGMLVSPPVTSASGNRTSASQARKAAPTRTSARPQEFSHAQRNILIRLEYKGGNTLDGPSNYAVTVLPDRSVTFIGVDGKSKLIACCSLVRRKTLSIGDYEELIRQLNATKLSQAKDYYPWPPDAPVLTITLIDEPFDFYHVTFSDFDCTAQRRKDFAGTNAAAQLPPEQLCQLGSTIQRLTGATAWGRQTAFGLRAH